MTRKLNILGLALIAILALGAVVVPAASAVKLVAAEYPATLDGAGVAGESTIFNFAKKEFTCKKTTLAATLEEPSSTLSLSRGYSECDLNGIFAATVTVNGCIFKLHLETTVDKDNFEASVDIECEGPNGIQFYSYSNAENHEKEIPFCAYEIPQQFGLKAVVLKNMTLAKPAINDVTILPNVKQIKYNRIAGMEVFCGPPTGTEGSYTGNTTTTATNKGGAQIALQVE